MIEKEKKMEKFRENAVIDAIMKRSSIRAYTSEKLEKEEIECLKKVALASPTARNMQHLRYVFITNEKIIADIENATLDAIYAEENEQTLEKIHSRKEKILYDTPLFVVIFGKVIRYGDVDAGIAAENLAIAAQGMGLGSVILGMPKAAFLGEKGEKLKKSLGIGGDLEYKIGIAIGHPATEKTPHTWDENHIITIE